MSPLEILSHDHNKNHADSANFLVSVEEILDQIILGSKLSQYDQTLIIWKPIGVIGDGVEFHCYNAGNGITLAETVVKFLNERRDDGYKWAQTPYANPKITELFKQYYSPDVLSIIETGPETLGLLAQVRL
jgi:hypothetical protein